MDPVTEIDTTWERRAACRDADVELFYKETESAEAAALSVCSACEVREECLAAAMARRELFGVWGGTRGSERRRVFRRESRGRGPARHHPAGQREDDSDAA